MEVGRDWVRRLHKVQCQRVAASPWGSRRLQIITIQIIRVVLIMVVLNMVNNMVSNNNAKVISILRNSSNQYSNNHQTEADNYQINNNKANTGSRNPPLQTIIIKEKFSNNFTKANIINNSNIMKVNTLINNKMINMRIINKRSHKFKEWLWTNCSVEINRIAIPGSLIITTTIVITTINNNNQITIILKVVAEDSNMEATQGITLNSHHWNNPVVGRKVLAGRKRHSITSEKITKWMGNHFFYEFNQSFTALIKNFYFCFYA